MGSFRAGNLSTASSLVNPLLFLSSPYLSVSPNLPLRSMTLPVNDSDVPQSSSQRPPLPNLISLGHVVTRDTGGSVELVGELAAEA